MSTHTLSVLVGNKPVRPHAGTGMFAVFVGRPVFTLTAAERPGRIRLRV